MKKEEIKKPKFKPLFSLGEDNNTDKPKTIEIAKVMPQTTGPEVEGESNIDGWISQYIPSAGTDRFVLISPKGEKYACKFFNPITNDFVGASMLAMYNLRDHYDRNIIPLEVREVKE